MKIEQVEFIKSVLKPADYPKDNVSEIAFAGRSNVGKSSLINKLVNRKGMAKTSSTPGRTQMINYFLINKKFYFVDLPGYGYAKVPIAMKDNWGKAIETYLMNSKNLKLVVLIIDARRKPTDLDRGLAEWMDHNEIAYIIAVTKIDKLTKTELHNQKRILFETYCKEESDKEFFIFFSAETGVGKKELLTALEPYI